MNQYNPTNSINQVALPTMEDLTPEKQFLVHQIHDRFQVALLTGMEVNEDDIKMLEILTMDDVDDIVNNQITEHHEIETQFHGQSEINTAVDYSENWTRILGKGRGNRGFRGIFGDSIPKSKIVGV